MKIYLWQSNTKNTNEICFGMTVDSFQKINMGTLLTSLHLFLKSNQKLGCIF